MDLVTVISLIVLLSALLLPVLAQVLQRHPRWFAAAKYVIFGVYILANLYETILFRAVSPERRAEWSLLWSYRESLAFPDGLMSLFRGTVEITGPACWRRSSSTSCFTSRWAICCLPFSQS